MSRIALVLAVLAGGCGFPAPGAGPASTDVDAAAGPDDARDPDALIDAAGTCAARPDHDGDGVGDACDPCPHIAEANLADVRADADGDGVGDHCDPDPSAPDARVLFEGFYDQASAFATVERSDGWTVAAGLAHIDDLAAANYDDIQWPMTVKRPAITIAGQAFAHGTETTGVNPAFGVESAVTAVPDQEFLCLVGLDAGVEYVEGFRYTNGDMTAHELDYATIPTFAAGTPFELNERFQRGTGPSPSHHHCDAFVGGAEHDADIDLPDVPPAGKIRLATLRWRVDVDYIFVVERSPL